MLFRQGKVSVLCTKIGDQSCLAQRREVAIPPFFRRAARVLTLKARWTPASSSTARLSRKGCWLARRCLACVLVPLFLFLGTRCSTFIFMTSGIPPAMSCLIHLINCAPATHFSASATCFSGGGGLASWLNAGLMPTGPGPSTAKALTSPR